jgi:predicted ribonuclease YlaK
LDWKQALDADEIRLVVPMTTLHELDELKNDEKERRAKARQ